ncbi:MAG: DUF2868 domain-containing protein [Proteobacteria bacterium]|nr:DUF2868 domain-containing protein [Pseudomonadota bacterium]
MDEDQARAVIALQAYETLHPPSPLWTDDDAGWATRAALQEPDAAGLPPEVYLARRARHALQRLAPREPGLRRWLARRLWRPQWIVVTAIAAFVLGIAADTIGSGQRIDLLSPPLWGVMAWNACVYLAALAFLLAHLARRHAAAPGPLRRVVERGLRRGLPAQDDASRRFAGLWLRASAPLSAQRAALLMHVGAAALALGLIAGMYARGLVLDYRAAWESTFLSAETVHAGLALLLGPASAATGIALPDVAGIAAMQTVHGSTTPGASAAPWIHLLATTLLGFVVLPRWVLALIAGTRARYLARRHALPLDDPYFQRLLRAQRGDAARVVVLPYAQTPGAQAALNLRTLLAASLGDTMTLRIAATIPHGAEDDAVLDVAADTTLAIALFDLAATPEAENQGRFIARSAAALPAGAATMVLVDEAAFVRRFGRTGDRLPQRRAAWRQLVEPLGGEPVFADLDSASSDRTALQAALAAPLRIDAAATR